MVHPLGNPPIPPQPETTESSHVKGFKTYSIFFKSGVMFFVPVPGGGPPKERPVANLTTEVGVVGQSSLPTETQGPSSQQPPPQGSGAPPPGPGVAQPGQPSSSPPLDAETSQPPVSEGSKSSVPPPSIKGGSLPGQPLMAQTPSPQPPQVMGLAGGQAGIVQQVRAASLLFSSREPGGAPSASVFQTSILFQQVNALDRGLTEMCRQIRQSLEGGKGLSPQQKIAMNALLNLLLKQFEGLQSQAQRMLGQPAGPGEHEGAPTDLLKAALTLKGRCDSLLSGVQGRLNGKLEVLAQQMVFKGAPSTALGGAKGDEKLAAPQQAPAFSQGEKAAALSSTDVTAGGEAKASLKPGQSQLPQTIHTALDLQALAKQLEKRELALPFNIALVYPLDKREQTPGIQGTKTAGSKEKSSGNPQSLGEGGGHCLAMILVPKGPAMIEGPFLPSSQILDLDTYLISTFPITNEQFADWLNEALDSKKIKVDERRFVLDPSGNILCKTHFAAPTSQIQLEVVGEKLLFRPLKGVERHPVVQVSYLGAEAFCKDNQFRLPTEAEWEKAAGMALPKEEEPLSKFRYGFGKDEITLSFANYREELREYDDNRTSPIGFYNGETLFTRRGKSYQSSNACSPYGCYDMSGNVREWTSDGEKDKKVAKGGSYNSPPEELLVSARSLFLKASCHGDTGLRVVMDL